MKKLKKAVLLCLFLFFTVYWVFAENKCISGSSKSNETTYKILDTCEYKDYDACVNVYEHKKSGAYILHWNNNDIDRGFGVAYKTLSQDNSGITHILEHCVCAGASKYGDTNLFFNVRTRTSNTYMNAFTGQKITTYMCSSLFEKQLLKFAEMLMNCTLDPIFLKDKRIFFREAYRAELQNRDSPININGIVLNEMTNCYNKGDRYKYFKFINSILKEPNYYDAGGNPDFITDTSFEYLVKTWKELYHPSNSLILLYGDIDADLFLNFLDKNFLSKYNKKEVYQNERNLEICAGPIEREICYPCAETDNNLEICDVLTFYYAKLDKKNSVGDNYGRLAEAFNNFDSPFKRILRNEIPGISAHVVCEKIGDNVLLIFNAGNINRSDKNKFKDIVAKSVDEVKNEGFCSTVINSFKGDIPSKKCKKIIDKEALKRNIVVSFICEASSQWTLNSDWGWIHHLIPDSTMSASQLIEMTKSFTDNPLNFGNVVAIPSSEMNKEKEKHRQNKLKKIKENMSENELDQLINFTNNMSNWVKKKENTKSYKYIDNITISDLDLEINIKCANKKYIDDIRVISTNHNTIDKVSSNSIVFGMSHMSKEERRLADTAISTLLQNRTKLHTISQVKNLCLNNFYDLRMGIGDQIKEGKTIKSAEICWTGLSENFETMLNIVREILTEFDFSDKNSILTHISLLKSRIAMSIPDKSINIMINRGMRSLSDKSTNSAFGSPLEIYKFLCQLETEMKNDPDAVIKKLKDSLCKLLCSKDVSVCVAYGDKFSRSPEELLCEFVRSIRLTFKENIFCQVESKVENYIERFGKKEAFIIENGGQYNGIVAVCPKFKERRARLWVLGEIITNQYLLREIRDRLGAYNCSIIFNEGYIKIISGSDPNTIKTFEVFQMLPNWLDKLEISQQDLDEYKKAVCTSVIKNSKNSPGDQISKALYEFDCNNENLLVNEIKNLTVNDIKEIANVVRDMLKSVYFFSVGSSDKISKEIDSFDNMLYFPTKSI